MCSYRHILRRLFHKQKPSMLDYFGFDTRNLRKARLLLLCLLFIIHLPDPFRLILLKSARTLERFIARPQAIMSDSDMIPLRLLATLPVNTLISIQYHPDPLGIFSLHLVCSQEANRTAH